MRNITMVANRYYVAGSGVRLVAVPPAQVASIYEGQSNIPPAMSLYAPGKHSPTARYVGDDASATACAERIGKERFTHLDHYFKPAIRKLAARLKILA
jgi:hypothetical protein